MSRRRRERRGRNQSAGNTGVVWLIAILLSMIAGYIGGQSAGIRSAFGNIHLVAPPFIGAITGLFVFPLFRGILFVCFGNGERTQILAVISTLLVSGFAGRVVASL